MEATDLPVFELDRTQTLQSQIHGQFVQWIGEGRLRPGTRLPASRTLGEQLGVSRNTVAAVMDQLKAEGFIDSQIGRGSFITEDLPVLSLEQPVEKAEAVPVAPKLSAFAQRLSQLDARHHDQALPFTPGVPDLKAFPNAIWQKLWRRHQDRTRLMGYDHDQGYRPLREALADYLRVSRGVRAQADQILITHGAQQAIALCAQMLLDDGDTLLHENPGYKGASSAFMVGDTHIVPVPLKDQVLDVAWLNQQSDQIRSAKLLYTTPTHQYPMGGLLSASDRLALLQWAREQQTWIIEDDYDSEFHFQHKPIAALQGMQENDQVIYMGSLSKTLFPSLRLGYLVLPSALVTPFTVAKSFVSGESPLIPQAVAADFIQEGHFARHLRRMRTLYKEKWTHLQHLIQTRLPDVEVVAESAGMHLVVEMPDVDDLALSEHLKTKGFGSSPLSSYYLEQPEKTGLVLGFANTNRAEREQLVDVLGSWL